MAVSFQNCREADLVGAPLPGTREREGAGAHVRGEPAKCSVCVKFGEVQLELKEMRTRNGPATRHGIVGESTL